MRALVIGLGSMGRKRTQILLEQGIQVFGVDPRADRRQYAEQHFQIESFDTFEKGLEISPDLLIVCNKPNEHLPYVKYGLEHGIHSFSEENCVSDFAEIDEIIALSGNPNRPVAATSCSFRYHPCVQLIKRAIDEERVGPRGKGFITYHCGSYLPDWHSYESVADYYVADKESGGGRDMLVFEYEWLQWIFGDVRSVTASTHKYGEFQADIFDTYQLLSQFGGGVSGAIVIDVLLRWSNRYFRYVSEYGEINWDYNSHYVNIYDARTNRWEHIPEAPISGPYKGWNQMDMYRDEIRHFIDAAKGKAEYCTGYRNEKRLNQITLAAEKSARTGAAVSIGQDFGDHSVHHGMS